MKKVVTKKRIPTPLQIQQVLRRVIDPDLRFNIVDLGLVYNIVVRGKMIRVTLTFTSIGCPHVPTILYHIEDELARAFSYYSAQIEVVWDPPWSKEKISKELREQLQGYLPGV